MNDQRGSLNLLCNTPWCAGWRHSAAMGYIWERRIIARYVSLSDKYTMKP